MESTNDVPVAKTGSKAVRLWVLAVMLVVGSVAVGLVSGVILMDYEDLYEPRDGEYWSWGSMKWLHRIGLIGSGAWWLGLAAGLYVSYRAARATMVWSRNR